MKIAAKNFKKLSRLLLPVLFLLPLLAIELLHPAQASTTESARHDGMQERIQERLKQIDQEENRILEKLKLGKLKHTLSEIRIEQLESQLAYYRAARLQLRKELKELAPLPAHAGADKHKTILLDQNCNTVATELTPEEHFDMFFKAKSWLLPVEHPTNPKSEWLKRPDSFVFECPSGTPVRCAANGHVLYSGYYGGYGKIVIVRNGDEHCLVYSHLSKTLVQENESLCAGQLVGLSGATGFSTKPHLGFGGLRPCHGHRARTRME